jgi:D-alanyl-D-alanine carboxypeptidase
MSDPSKGVAMIANKHYQLGDYAPDDLVQVDWKYRYGLQNDKYQIRQEAYDAYVEMWEAAHNEGIYLLLLSGYRSKAEQEKEYKYYKDYKGEKYADTIAARPGWSEHQTGLAIDIYSKADYSADTFDTTPTFKWLSENSYKYGYILRYTKGNEDITGYKYESWHYRYIGKELAAKVVESGLTYDEYYAYYLDN